MPSLLLLNGSPRGPRSNSMKMLTRLAEGWERGGGGPVEVLHLARPDHFARAVAAFPEAGQVLLGLPLYTDMMPGLVLAFVEALAPRVGAAANPPLAFLVQSGFPEALHARPLERWLAKLARRLEAPYGGTVVRGGGEALQAMPEGASRKLWARLRMLGEQLAREGRFREEDLRAVAGLERLSPLAAAVAALAARLPLAQFYWNAQLRKNGAWERRFAAPFGAAFGGPRTKQYV